MSALTVRLPDEKHARLRALAQSRAWPGAVKKGREGDLKCLAGLRERFSNITAGKPASRRHRSAATPIDPLVASIRSFNSRIVSTSVSRLPESITPTINSLLASNATPPTKSF
jgi:hypothetical protein